MRKFFGILLILFMLFMIFAGICAAGVGLISGKELDFITGLFISLFWGFGLFAFLTRKSRLKKLSMSLLQSFVILYLLCGCCVALWCMIISSSSQRFFGNLLGFVFFLVILRLALSWRKKALKKNKEEIKND